MPSATGQSDHIAFNGEVELLNAKWDLDSGRTVEFRIAGNFETMRHPFKDFTRKRAGRVGTRFKAVSARSLAGEINYDGEMMLADWQEKPGSGMTVKFWLDDEATLHPYAGCTRKSLKMAGEMFALCLVELTDDDQPELQQRKPGEKAPRHSSDAHLMITNERFLQYMRESRPNVNVTWTGDTAKTYVKQLLGIESLAVLDHNAEKRKLLLNQVTIPYRNWFGGR
jgi:hypothetical protein